MIDETLIDIAVEVARSLAVAARKGTRVQFDAISTAKHLATIQDRVRGIVKAKSKLTSIGGLAGEVADLLSCMQRDIGADLTALRAELRLDDDCHAKEAQRAS